MAEQIVGPGWSSYNQTVEHILQMDDMIFVLSPQDIPLTGGVGGENVPLLSAKAVKNRTWFWQEESEPQPYTITALSIIDAVITTVDVTNGTGTNFRVGDHIRIENEVMKITGINTTLSPDRLTVVRGAVGTTAVAHTTVGTQVVGIGTALPEGQIGDSSYLGRDSFSNFTQIFSGKLTVTRTEQSIPKYGVSNELLKQMAVQMKHIMLSIENSAKYGIKFNDATTKVRSSGGFKSSVVTAANVDSTNAWMTLARVEALLAVIHAAGGQTDGLVLMSRPANFAALNNLTDTGRVRQVDVGDSRRGRSKARVLMTEYGDVTLARDRRMLPGDAFLFNPAQFVKRLFQPLIQQPLAKTQDEDNFMLVTELGWQIKGVDQHARFSVLDSTQALPGSGLV